ncbi:MAG: YggS family pyridoxal phosphate-dependent enzyme [Pseudomonadota bacterium]
MAIQEKLLEINQKLAEVCSKHHRQPEAVLLLAVSKFHPFEKIEQAYAAGQRHFAESYWQEAEEKIATNPHKDLIWHFIGPIQSNKTRGIAGHFDWVHSVDRKKIIERLNEHRGLHAELPPLNLLLQVNISEEPQKSGCLPEELDSLIAATQAAPHLNLRGLMAIAENVGDDTSRLQKQFARLQGLFAKYQTKIPTLDTLSMGMSNDYELAIANGSTMVRLGTAIFGPRPA